LSAEELLARRIARAERNDPERVIRLLEPLVLPRRKERLLGVLGRRLASVSVVFDAPYDPHNGAAVVRTCDAFGVQTLHVVQEKPFLAAGSVARGAEKWVDVVTHATPRSAIDALRAEKLVLVGAHPEGELTPEDLTSLPRFALVVGNERDGIRPELADACEKRVRVPMRGFIESLNVSVTVAILLQAATRGREGDLDEATVRRLYARGLYFSVPHAEDVLASDRPGERAPEAG
jgi:tRNA (guanosine-2'-O-)-methyltransferase